MITRSAVEAGENPFRSESLDLSDPNEAGVSRPPAGRGVRPLLRHRLVAIGRGEDPRGGAELGGPEALEVAEPSALSWWQAASGFGSPKAPARRIPANASRPWILMTPSRAPPPVSPVVMSCCCMPRIVRIA